MAKMRIAIERRNQEALQKRAAENRRNATAELNSILSAFFLSDFRDWAFYAAKSQVFTKLAAEARTTIDDQLK